MQVQSLALLSGLRVHIAVSCGVGRKCGLDPALLWLWCRPVATALIRSLAWEPPYALGAAPEKTKNKQTKQTNKQTKTLTSGSSRLGSAEMNPTSNHEDRGSISDLAQWVEDPGLP